MNCAASKSCLGFRHTRKPTCSNLSLLVIFVQSLSLFGRSAHSRWLLFTSHSSNSLKNSDKAAASPTVKVSPTKSRGSPDLSGTAVRSLRDLALHRRGKEKASQSRTLAG